MKFLYVTPKKQNRLYAGCKRTTADRQPIYKGETYAKPIAAPEDRARAMEKCVMCRQIDLARPTASYERIARYEPSIDVHLYRAIAALEEKGICIQKNSQNEPRVLNMF
jgi:hypothetical protein